MELKVNKADFMPDPEVVKDSYIHPRLVKKRPDNSLSLPQPFIDRNVKDIASNRCRVPQLQYLQQQIEA